MRRSRVKYVYIGTYRLECSNNIIKRPKQKMDNDMHKITVYFKDKSICMFEHKDKNK